MVGFLVYMDLPYVCGSPLQVLRGSGSKGDVVVRSPDGNAVDQHFRSDEGVTDKFMSVGEGAFSYEFHFSS